MVLLSTVCPFGFRDAISYLVTTFPPNFPTTFKHNLRLLRDRRIRNVVREISEALFCALTARLSRSSPKIPEYFPMISGSYQISGYKAVGLNATF